MTKAAKPAADAFIEQLEAAITKTLKNPKATAKDKNQAIANGIKLAMIKHRISPDEGDGEFFGG
jgi:hypothetical protein